MGGIAARRFDKIVIGRDSSLGAPDSGIPPSHRTMSTHVPEFRDARPNGRKGRADYAATVTRFLPLLLDS